VSLGDLVSVVVPAYNAERFLDQTLRSVRAQTHRALDIVVIDDGSTDGTSALVERHQAEDPRIRLITQPNFGVGAARNAGIANALGSYIAPIDADDLWHPLKIERQLQMLKNSGRNVGLVYTWCKVIDEDGRVVSTRSKPTAEGDVLAQMCVGNLTGNASSALMPKDIVLKMGGYDETLHSRNEQGCEDLKLYWLIAEQYEFACVKEFLTGYRVGRGNMSNDYLRMLRSFDSVMSGLRVRRSDLAFQFHRGRIETLRGLVIRALRARARGEARRLLEECWRYDRAACFLSLLRLPIYFTRLALEIQGRNLLKWIAGKQDTFLSA
jgi:glycosyltransferase involved in cell wall biosynthesis